MYDHDECTIHAFALYHDVAKISISDDEYPNVHLLVSSIMLLNRVTNTKAPSKNGTAVRVVSIDAVFRTLISYTHFDISASSASLLSARNDSSLYSS